MPSCSFRLRCKLLNKCRGFNAHTCFLFSIFSLSFPPHSSRVHFPGFPFVMYLALYHFLCPTFIPRPSLLLSLLYSLCVFRSVSSARPSYIPGMPATYGPHSSRSAERPTAPHCWPCGDQPKAERATALLLPKIIHRSFMYLCLHRARSY